MAMGSAKSEPVGSPESRQGSNDASGYSVQIEKREENIGDITCDICGNTADPEFSDEEHALCSKGYTGSDFIPIMHEKVLVFADFTRLTWHALIQRVLEELGGQATLDGIYTKTANHPRHLSVPTWMATVRRTLQEMATHVTRGVWRL